MPFRKICTWSSIGFAIYKEIWSDIHGDKYPYITLKDKYFKYFILSTCFKIKIVYFKTSHTHTQTYMQTDNYSRQNNIVHLKSLKLVVICSTFIQRHLFCIYLTLMYTYLSNHCTPFNTKNLIRIAFCALRRIWTHSQFNNK